MWSTRQEVEEMAKNADAPFQVPPEPTGNDFLKHLMRNYPDIAELLRGQKETIVETIAKYLKKKLHWICKLPRKSRADKSLHQPQHYAKQTTGNCS